jgi:hypothetical protein
MGDGGSDRVIFRPQNDELHGAITISFFVLVTAWPTASSSAEFDRIFGASNVELNREAWLSLFGTSAKRDCEQPSPAKKAAVVKWPFACAPRESKSQKTERTGVRRRAECVIDKGWSGSRGR